MPGCSDPGGCANSKDNGGIGCHLCDVIAKLPQPKFRMPAAEGGNVKRDGAPPSKARRKR
jgi:hypothetical protein